MAENEEIAQKTSAEEKKRIKEEKKRLKEENKRLAKEMREARALEEDEEQGGALSVVLISIFIVLIWLAFAALFIKLDVGGFGSGVLRPYLKDVPVLNKLLPPPKGSVSDSGEDLYYGYSDMEDAVARIKDLELQIQDLQEEKNEYTTNVEALEEEIKRLRTFENKQVEFEKIKNEFYNEVVFADKAPAITEYKKYYEEIDPENAEAIYREVVGQVAYDEEVENYAKAYSAMKPKQAAGIFEAMTDDLQLAAKILGLMSADDRGKILGVMDAEIAARITEIMEPDER
ncbi:MAG: hypothetical protein IKR68_06330 [Lachnospiraceae bacterium]|nr:hypothetical protein [Lachnospiraceae bacterium]